MLCLMRIHFPAKDGLQSSELLPVVSSQGTPLPSPSFSLSTSNLQHSSPIISDSPDSPLESLPIPTSPHISTLPSPIPGPAPTLSIPEFSSSSNHSHHPMTTRSQTGNLKPRTFSDFKLYSTQYPLQALSKEYDALLANETWKLCPRPVDHNVVGNKWVYKVKQTSTGEVDRFKARLVALGFAQEEGIDFTETFSPVIKPSTVRVLLTLSVQFDWEIRQLDVSNAFLHGILLEDVYMEQPKGFVNSDFPDYVCKLNKSLYGLKQAPRAWFMRLSQTLLEFDFLSSPVDASLFVYHKGHIHLFILIYVDDILVTGTDPSLIQSLIQKLQTEFKMKDLGPLGYFLGIQASRDSSGLHLRQSKYIGDLLHRTKMAGAKPASSPCTTGLKLSTHVGEPLTASQITEYRQTVGALQYCTLTRPDIAFSVNQLCQHMHCPNSVHWTAAKRVLRYLKGTIDLGLWYTKGEQTLQAFCDSDWAGNPDDRRSTTGYGVFFGSCLISWTAKKQSVVARSSTEAEYRALAITTAELYWIRMLLKELHISLPTAPTIWCDNSGALALASNPVFHARTKHIEVDFHFIREKVANRDISLQFIGSYDQPADIFTKGLKSYNPSSTVVLRPHEARLLQFLLFPFGEDITFHELLTAAIKRCDVVSIRTCQEIEGPFSDYMERRFGKPVFVTGPVLVEPSPLAPEDRWTQWPGGFKPGSVIFCAFGSQNFTEKNQFQELLLGFELTGLPFLAALKPPLGAATIEEALPEEFQERIGRRGVVHGGWAPQSSILSHPSVGCFVSHYGFGSMWDPLMSDPQIVLVPELCDQTLNARLLAEELKVAVEVEKEENGWVSKESLCKAVKSVMDEEDEVGCLVKKNHAKWKERSKS
ncbi:Retrovirus-related Pol polyprotein from transposon RE1 [Vitis vinifera]|uniref:Retrovirus-related Pol polyprotein from transposon RE1 n=1 Tax=Vitis vinifera TaxID=29760 RepID=A0A438H4E3_VITVI|nr:Retrovirus-related Pol polyprotein from transposon RE1 [Vitis vinifera]